MAASKVRTANALALAIAVPLALAGCVPTAFPEGEPAAETPTPVSSETVPAEDEDALLEHLTFAAGSELAPTSSAQWGDAMLSDDDWELTSPDDGNGSWSYTHVSTQCIVGFWQGDIAELSATADDRELSDELLAWFFKGSASDITPHAVDETLPLGFGGAGEMDVRSVRGVNPETNGAYVVSARGFHAFHGGYVVSVTCPDGVDPLEFRDTIRDTHIPLLLMP